MEGPILHSPVQTDGPRMTIQPRVIRIQDSRGRGPFQPGFSRVWADEDFAPGQKPMPTWMEEFGLDLIRSQGAPGMHFGTAVRTLDQLFCWFSETERQRLAALDFHIVSLKIRRVLAESKNQLVFERGRPLNHGAIVIPWRAAA